MPRRNQSGAPRKGSARSGQRSGQRSATGKSFKKPDKAGTRSSKSPRSYGAKSGASGSSRQTGRSKSQARPYKRSSSTSESSRRDERPSSDSPRGGFGKRSRFAKTPNRTSGGSIKGVRSEEQTPRVPRKSSSKPRGHSGSTLPKTVRGGEHRKERGASYGKPYKKTYEQRGDRPRTGGSRRRISTVEADATVPKSDKIRLNKFIANSGVSSRREADELIKLGLISVNGKIISELGYKISPGDEVRYEDRVLRAEKPVYILMNKPKGFLTTTDDPQERKTVMHILGSAVKERVYPVGRLDRNTTGLLLLTNDGDLADKLMHPSFNVKKVYKVELDRPLVKNDFQAIVEGVRLEEGRAQVDDLAIVSEDSRTVGIELHIGWNRVVRRIFESLGYDVIRLDRTVYAGLDKKELSRGQWRFLTKEEIIHLKHFK
jgi:23S rRNA pseudouridine2605 synthase